MAGDVIGKAAPQSAPTLATFFPGRNFCADKSGTDVKERNGEIVPQCVARKMGYVKGIPWGFEALPTKRGNRIYAGFLDNP